MYLNPARFNRHLAKIGQKLGWRRSWACACVNPDSGAPDPKHQLCGGKGRFWDALVITTAGVSHSDVNVENGAPGQWETGDMTMSIPESSVMYDNIGQFDRVLMLNSTDVFSQPLKRGSPSERLLFTVKDFARVFTLDPTSRLPVDYPLPVVDTNGNLSWPNNDGPPFGTVYSITGNKYDEYYCFLNYPSDRGEHSGARLPKRVAMRLFDLYGRSNVSA